MWRIPKPCVPDQAPNDSQEAEQEERRSPSIAQLNRHDEEWRQGGTGLTGQPYDAPGSCAPGSWDPATDDRCCIGIRACFSDSKTEPHEQQNVEVRHSPGETGKGRPPGNHAGEDAARANAISQSARGYFECAVGKEENAGYPAPGCGADVQGVLHARSGDGDADAVQIGDLGDKLVPLCPLALVQLVQKENFGWDILNP